MKVIEHIKNSKKTLFSFEILPPLKGENFRSIEKNIAPLLEYKPSFIDVTYHQQEVEYKELKNGTIEKRTVRKRPGTVGIAAAIQYKAGIDVVPHLICGGFTKEETENALIDLYFLGIDNLLLLRGDPPSTMKYFKPEIDGHKHALGLVEQVKNMNQGIYMEEDLENAYPTNFCIGIAGYPEKHSEAPNKRADLEYLKKKVEAGAEYIVTQMFYDNNKYFKFVEECRNFGINVPIIPGLKPIATLSQIRMLPQVFHIDIPQDMFKELQRCTSNEEVRDFGIQWSIAQCRELIEKNAPVLHFYTMGKPDNVQKIINAVF